VIKFVGIIYGKVAGTIVSDKDIAKYMQSLNLSGIPLLLMFVLLSQTVFLKTLT